MLRPFFMRVGGKKYMVKVLLPLFPSDYDVFVDVFGGAGNILFAHEKQGVKEVYNDKDRFVYDMMKGFQQLDKSALEHRNWRPSRRLFKRLKDSNPTSLADKVYRNLYLNTWSFRGDNRSFYIAYGSPDRIKNKFQRFDQIQDKLKGVVLLNKDYKAVVRKYDGKDTFFFFDPPYADTDTGSYGDHTDVGMEELAGILRNIKGKWMLTYTDRPDIRRLFKGFKIRRVTTRYATSREGHRPAKEIIVTNYR